MEEPNSKMSEMKIGEKPSKKNKIKIKIKNSKPKFTNLKCSVCKKSKTKKLCFCDKNLLTQINDHFHKNFDKQNSLNELKHIFDKKLKGKKYIKTNSKHCGEEGHYIEKCFGLELNAKNEPDFKGFEIKKKSKKITFGDWSSTGYLFKQDNYMKSFNNIPFNITRNDYMKYFGNYNIDKKRYSWSGRCIPKYNEWNYNGTIIVIDNNNNIYIVYSNNKDTRNIKLPNIFTKQEYIILQYWKQENIKKFVENKFNKHGFVIFEKNNENIYSKMLIGNTIDFKKFIELFKNNKIIFDSGMYEGNTRNYSQFRSTCNIFMELIIEEYC
jgi:hypothetical protein